MHACSVVAFSLLMTLTFEDLFPCFIEIPRLSGDIAARLIGVDGRTYTKHNASAPPCVFGRGIKIIQMF